MGILDHILANKMLAVANKIAPVISSSILIGYVMAGRRISIVVGDGNSQEVIAKHKEYQARADKFFNVGGG